MNTQTFTGVTQEKVQKLAAELESQGGITSTTQADGPVVVTYQISLDGFEATTIWDQSQSTLVVTVSKKPWYIPMQTIWSKFDAELAGS